MKGSLKTKTQITEKRWETQGSYKKSTNKHAPRGHETCSAATTHLI